MYMMGVTVELEFERLADELIVHDDVAPHVNCPSLFVQGEFDELRPVDDALLVFDQYPEPNELWILEDQFHPMGEWADELPSLVVEWLQARVSGVPLRRPDRRLYLRQDGSFVDGDASPPGWRPE